MSVEDRRFRTNSSLYIDPEREFETFPDLHRAVERYLHWWDLERNDYYKPSTPEELALGMFKEGIEPQLQNAVYAMHHKGYDVLGSGTDGFDHHVQTLYIAHEISDPKLHKELADLGARTDIHNFNSAPATEIYFLPEKPQLKSIEHTWSRITDIFPDTGNPPVIRTTAKAEKFRLGEVTRKEKYEAKMAHKAKLAENRKKFYEETGTGTAIFALRNRITDSS